MSPWLVQYVYTHLATGRAIAAYAETQDAALRTAAIHSVLLCA